MNCGTVRAQLLAGQDEALEAHLAANVEGHLASCQACADYAASLHSVLADLRGLPRLAAPESIAARVLARIEAETRGPGLRALYVSAWARRPLLVPSLLPATLLLGLMLGTALLLGPDVEELPQVAAATLRRAAGFTPAEWRGGLGGAAQHPPATMTVEWNTAPAPIPGPLLPMAAVVLRRLQVGRLGEREVLDHMVEGSLFVETIVGTDGNVSAVNVLAGNQELATPLRDALWQERFAPTRYRGRLVEVSIYRLISRMEVRAPLT